LTDADVVVGSRYAPGGEDARTSRLRVGSSRVINAFASSVLGRAVRDYTSGFVAARRTVLDHIPLRTDYVYGEYCIDFLYRAVGAGVRIREIPYRCGERWGGETKTAPDLGRFALLGLAYLVSIVKLRFR